MEGVPLDEGFRAVLLPRDRVLEWHLDDIRLRDDDRELRMQHRQDRAALGWNQEGVEAGELFHAVANWRTSAMSDSTRSMSVLVAAVG